MSNFVCNTALFLVGFHFLVLSRLISLFQPFFTNLVVQECNNSSLLWARVDQPFSDPRKNLNAFDGF